VADEIRGLEVSDVKKLRQLEEENRRLKQMVAEQAMDIQALQATHPALAQPKAYHHQRGAVRFALGLTSFCGDRLQRLDIHRLLGHHLLQSPVSSSSWAQFLHIADFQAAYFVRHL